MGAVISLVICEIALVVTGLLTSIAAAKSTGDALKYSAVSATIAFIAAVISLLIAIFLL